MPPRNQRKQSSPKTSKRNLSNARLLFWSAVPFPAQSVRRTHVIAPPRNLRKGPTSPRGGRRRGSPLHERASDLARAPPTRTTATTTEQRSACFLRGRENHLARRPCCHPPPRRVVAYSRRAAPPRCVRRKVARTGHRAVTNVGLCNKQPQPREKPEKVAAESNTRRRRRGESRPR